MDHDHLDVHHELDQRIFEQETKLKVLITGSLGLVGSAAVRYYLNEAAEVIGVDNDMRKHFFGPEASVIKNKIDHGNYTHHGVDIGQIEPIIAAEKPDVIIHCAAQPSHDFSATNPLLDFGINAYSTLMLLEMVRKHVPDSVFVFTSTNKVYGDTPNFLPLVEKETRYECEVLPNGIAEAMSVDNSQHSPFGVSKLAADIYVQEYARYFGLKTGVFRCGCITGAAHAGAELHGFLAYMARCKKENRTYRVFGYDGKQVRDQIHASDLVRAMDCFVRAPKPGAVYNMGGGTHANISVIEALNWLKIKDWEYVDQARKGDHKWYVSDVSKFRTDYPEWDYKYNLWAIFDDLTK
jgi:CDP-paratose 2-epimerase